MVKEDVAHWVIEKIAPIHNDEVAGKSVQITKRMVRPDFTSWDETELTIRTHTDGAISLGNGDNFIYLYREEIKVLLKMIKEILNATHISRRTRSKV